MYRLVGRLEASELSELYRAEREGAGSVVIKLFHPKTTDLAYAKVIADVAQRLAEVPQGGVARVLQVGLLNRRLAIVREDSGRYTLGQALTRLNTREVVLPPAVAIGFVIEVAGILEAAHGGGVVHGALTPGNVLLGSDGAASVADFGALRALLASPGLRKAFGSRGRSSYRAPELKALSDSTPATDVYALGAMAYELLTLKEPTIGRDSLTTRQAEKLPPPSRLVRRVHSRIDAIVMRALESSPARRQRSCLELADALREFLSAQGGVPGRGDVKKFVEELFPRDVVLNALGPPPFTTPFELEPIDGVSDLVASLELPEADDRRAPFSGGAVDDRTSTSDGLPVFSPPDETTNPGQGGEAAQPLELRQTIRLAGADRPEVTSPGVTDTLPPGGARITWEAPAGKVATSSADSASGEAVERRVRVIEDFSPNDTMPPTPAAEASRATGQSAQKLGAVGPKPSKDASERQALKTQVTFAAAFKRDTDEQPHDWRKDRELRRRAGVQAVRGGAAILTFVTLGLVGFWLLKSPDPVGDLISWTPAPIEVELLKLRRPKGLAVPGPTAPLPKKLPDFDQVNKTVFPKADEPPPPPRKVEAPKPVKPPPAPVRSDCYAPPANVPTAFLTVAVKRAATVFLDGVRVCGGANKLPVAPGQRALKVVDSKTKQEWKSTLRLEAGKHAKVDPNFR
ncbi:MAG: serine/threonine protein kinase [Myxococcaceae bacterium]|nr:serine/threonine protein kinase [Myxococcaceae bacterium]